MPNYRISFQELLGKKTHDKVWDEADDVIESNRPLGIMYENVPDDLKDIEIQVMEIHIFPEEHRERLTDYLNSNSGDDFAELIKDI